MRNKFFRKEWIGLILLLFISIFFRFYNLHNLFQFSLDEEVIALNVRRITTGAHFPAIGVNAADTGLYLGPFYYYAAAPLFLLLNNQPLAGAIFASLIGVLATGAIYLLGKEAAGSKVGFVAGLIHAISLPIVLFERKFFNPNPAILIIALTLLSLLKIRQGEKKYLYLLAASLGALFHLNLALLIYLPISFIWLILNKIKFTRNILIKAVLIFSVFILPLLFFDIRHQFTLTKAAANLLTFRSSIQNETKTFTDFTFPFRYLAKIPLMDLRSPNITQELATCPQATKNPPSLIGTIILLITLIVFSKLKKPVNRLFLLSLGLGVVALWFYPGRIQEYYGLILAPAYLILVSQVLTKLTKGRWGIAALLMLILIITNFGQLLSITNSHGLAKKALLAQQIVVSTTPHQFALLHQGNSCFGYGLQYLLFINNHPPGTSFIDPVIGWLYHEREKPQPDLVTQKVTLWTDQESIEIFNP